MKNHSCSFFKKAVCVLLPFVILSCSEEQRMHRLIKNYLYQTLDDYKSYEPISFSSIDSCYSDWTMDPLLPVIEDNYKRASRAMDSLKRVQNYKISHNYSFREMTDDINMYVTAAYYTTVAYSHKKDSIKRHYVSEFLGFGINHLFRSNNKLGGTERHNVQFIIDPSKKYVIDVRNIDKGEEITNHHKVYNEEEKEVIKRQEKLKQYPGIKEQGQVFLEKNKTADGIIVTPSGLQYRVIKEGKGKSPSSENTVEYKTTIYLIRDELELIGNTETSKNQVKWLISGLVEALQIMKPGSVFEVFLPYELAFGENGSGVYPPYAALKVDIELIRIIN